MVQDVVWPGILVSIVLFITIAGVLIALIWQGFGVWRVKVAAREAVAWDEAFRRLAEEATAAQRETAGTLQALKAELADLRSRVTEIERLLREVG
jgi:Tfp pilus assembly protein PilO